MLPTRRISSLAIFRFQQLNNHNYSNYYPTLFCKWNSTTNCLSSSLSVKSYHTENSISPVGDSTVSSPSLLRASSYIQQHLSPGKIHKLQKLFTLSSEGKESSFLQDIYEAKNMTEVTDIFERQTEIEMFELVILFDILFNLIKDASPALKKATLNSVGMQKMLKILRRKSRHMDSSDLISVVKLLSALGCQQTDLNLEITFKILSKKVNHLELSQLQYLHFLISRFNPSIKSNIASALNFALPVVFESQITSHSMLESEHLQSLCDYLFYATKYNISDKVVRLIINAIQKSQQTLSPQQAKSIVWSLADVKKYPREHYQEPLITNCFTIMAESIESLSLEELNTTISKAANRYIRNLPYFYHEDFIQACCYRFMSRSVDSISTMWALRWISVMKHINVEFLDRVGELIAKTPSEVLNNDNLFFILVRSFAGLNYKPEKWDKFEALFLNHPALTKDNGGQDIHLAIDLLSLETYPEALIHKIFSPESLPQLDIYLQRNPINYASALLLLYHGTQQLIQPEYTGPLPPISMIQRWKELVHQDLRKGVFSLKPVLQTAFGGENYILSGISHEGLFIDHAVILRKGGFAIATNSTNTLTELSTIVKPPEAEIVLIKVFYKEAFANNTPRLRGVHALEQRILEKLGHAIVTIDFERWSQLPDFEKIPYIMKKIREKMEKFNWSYSNDVIPS